MFINHMHVIEGQLPSYRCWYNRWFLHKLPSHPETILNKDKNMSNFSTTPLLYMSLLEQVMMEHGLSYPWQKIWINWCNGGFRGQHLNRAMSKHSSTQSQCIFCAFCNKITEKLFSVEAYLLNTNL